MCDNVVLAMRGVGWDGGEDDDDAADDAVCSPSHADTHPPRSRMRHTRTHAQAGPIAMGSVSDWCVRHVLSNIIVVKT